MTITAQQVYDEVTYLIPTQNVLTEEQILGIAQSLIDRYGDGDENLGIVKCNTLKQIGVQNSILGSLSSGSVKREKLGDSEIEYFQGSTVDWSAYIKAVNDDLCPLFGVQVSVSFGAKINSSEKKPIFSPCYSDLYL